MNVYTIEEISKLLKVTPRTVIKYIGEGKLGSVKPSTRCTRITEKQFNVFLKKFEVKT